MERFISEIQRDILAQRRAVFLAHPFGHAAVPKPGYGLEQRGFFVGCHPYPNLLHVLALFGGICPATGQMIPSSPHSCHPASHPSDCDTPTEYSYLPHNPAPHCSGSRASPADERYTFVSSSYCAVHTVRTKAVPGKPYRNSESSAPGCRGVPAAHGRVRNNRIGTSDTLLSSIHPDSQPHTRTYPLLMYV